MTARDTCDPKNTATVNQVLLVNPALTFQFKPPALVHFVQPAMRLAVRWPELGEIAITTTPSNDLRSYHVSSAKIKGALGWEPKRTIDDAVVGLCAAFKDGRIPMDALTDPRYINVKTVQAAGLH